MDYKKALGKCMALCSKAEYCSFDVRKKLQGWELDYDEQDQIIEELIKEKFLSDERYVEAYVRDKFRFNRWGKIKIAYMLKQKQLSGEVVNNAILAIDDEDYLALIKDELLKKAKGTKGKNEYDIKAKIVRYLVSKGFESEHVYAIYNKHVNNC